MTEWAANREFAALEKDYWHKAALEFDCTEPGCEAKAGERCQNLDGGGPLGRFPAHWRRIKAAEEAS